MNEPRKGMKSRWSLSRKRRIDCSHPKGFSQKNYCKRQKRGGRYTESFKEWLLAEDKPITNVWPVNKSMFDMSSEEGRKEYQDALEYYFSFKKDRNRKLVSEEGKTEPYTIMCWRGCDKRSLERDTVEIGKGYRVLSGKDAMEGILWFTHSLQRKDLGGKEYSDRYAKDYLITYPLEAACLYTLRTYDNGETEEVVPPEILEQFKLSNRSNYFLSSGRAYQVPEGWFFTWQNEKHLACSKPLKIYDNMIKAI
jgi:hypothetical protein